LATGRLIPAVVASLLAMIAPVSATDNAGRTTAVAPGVLFYDRPAAGLVGPEDALRSWPRLASIVATEFPDGLTSGVLFAHFYTVGKADFTSAEWVLAALNGRKDGPTVALLRFTFDGQRLIAAYRQALSGQRAIDRSGAADIVRQTPLYRDVSPGRTTLDQVGGFFFFVSLPTDFGGTEVVARDDGKLVFAATTVYDGTGQLLFPSAQ
jgi:hypothetical protein